MLRDKLMKNPIPGREPPKVEVPKVNEEQLIKMIESNPQLKQVITTNSEQFKQLLSTNQQLKTLFEGKDVDSGVAKVYLKDPEDDTFLFAETEINGGSFSVSKRLENLNS